MEQSPRDGREIGTGDVTVIWVTSVAGHACTIQVEEVFEYRKLAEAAGVTMVLVRGEPDERRRSEESKQHVARRGFRRISNGWD